MIRQSSPVNISHLGSDIRTRRPDIIMRGRATSPRGRLKVVGVRAVAPQNHRGRTEDLQTHCSDDGAHVVYLLPYASELDKHSCPPKVWQEGRSK